MMETEHDDPFLKASRAAFMHRLASQADHLLIAGVVYPLAEWLTLAQYAEKYDVSVRTLFSRFERGSLPADAVLSMPAWNLKLIRDQAYAQLPRGLRPGGGTAVRPATLKKS